MRLLPAYVHPSGHALYQTGLKRLASTALGERVEFLAMAGIGLAVGVASALDDELSLYVQQRHVPFGDNQQFRPHMPVVTEVAREAAIALQEGSVLTYCSYGVNRSGLLNALIIREVEHCTGTAALARLRERRRGACGGNSSFVSYLEELACP